MWPDYQPVQTDVNVPLPGEMQICGKPGDVFIFAQNLWHAGSPNRSDFTRRQLLGAISENYFKFYIPEELMVPLKKFCFGGTATISEYI
jgi:ectoine hydroxylase-related dioxygenase (phytanoyl-CoA dioxygenase family)